MTAVITGLIVSMVPHAAAQLIAYETFDTAPGSLTGTSGATSFGWSGNWTHNTAPFQVVAGSLSAPASVSSFYSTPSTGNHAYGDLNFRQAVRPATATLSGPSLYASVLLHPQANFNAAATARFDFDGASGAFTLTADGNSGVWHVSNGFTTVPTTVPGNQLSLVILEVAFNTAGINDTVNVWFNKNPTLATPDFSSSALDFGTPGFISAFFSSSGNFSGATLAVDELRIGGSLASVLPVPEPGTYALFALGLGAALCRLRKRS